MGFVAGGGFYCGGGLSNDYGSGAGGSSLVPAGGSRTTSNDAPAAHIAYQVPVTAVAASTPQAPALQSTSFTATASTGLPGHSASATEKIASVSIVGALAPEAQASDVSCIVATCTSTKAGWYTAQVSFGNWWPSTLYADLGFTQLGQTIDFATSTLNVQQPTLLTATATSGLPVSYTLDSGPCTLQGSTLTANDNGSCSVTASQAGGNPYTAAQNVTRTFDVTPVALIASTDPAALTATAGVAYAFPVVLQDAQGAPVSPQPVIDYSFEPGCGFNSDRIATRAGSCEVTATVRGSTSLTTTFTVDVVAADLAQLEITPSATSVPQGGSLTFAVAGKDAFGNPVDTSGVTLSSSVASDQISGLTVSFPHASPHVITARIGSVTASVSIEVIANSVPNVKLTDSATGLSNTGQADGVVTMMAAAALALMALGAGLILVHKSG